MDKHPARERLQLYLAGLLNEADSRKVEDHLAAGADVCPPIVDRIADGEEPDESNAAPTDVWGSVETVAGNDTSPTTDHGPRNTSPPGYQILDKLGHGGMGIVYKARQVRANRLVALKMILSGDYAAAADRERFKS